MKRAIFVRSLMETKRARFKMTERRLSAVAAAVLLIGGAIHAKANPILYGTAYSGSTGPASLYTINSTTGAATLVGATGFERVGAIDFDPLNGMLYGEGYDPITNSTDLITINPTTGLAAAVGTTFAGNSISFQDIAFRSDGTLFGYSGGKLYTLNLTTGAATLIGSVNSFPSGNALAFSSSNTLYTVNNSQIQTVNQTTGAGTTVATPNYPNPPLNSFPAANGMKFDFSTGILWASVVNGGGVTGQTNWLTNIDVMTGDVTVIGQTVKGLDSLAVAPSVPDSMSTLWLALPLSGLLLFGRFRRA